MERVDSFEAEYIPELAVQRIQSWRIAHTGVFSRSSKEPYLFHSGISFPNRTRSFNLTQKPASWNKQPQVDRPFDFENTGIHN
jgi:hypothetical protein